MNRLLLILDEVNDLVEEYYNGDKMCCIKWCMICTYHTPVLFHDYKQMGLVLKKSFKGTHLWIPPIKQQYEDIKKCGYAKSVNYDLDDPLFLNDPIHNNGNYVKIDAMLFTVDEQPVRLLDGDNETAFNKNSYRNADTFILCNPNAMAY